MNWQALWKLNTTSATENVSAHSQFQYKNNSTIAALYISTKCHEMIMDLEEIAQN